MIPVLVLWLLLLSPALAQAVAYYAEAAGDDAADCTVGTPCQSAARLIERTLAPGDTLALKCGETYRETVTIDAQSSGTSGARITLTQYGTCFTRQGTHTGANNASVLTDSTADFVTTGVAVGQTLFNLTDGSSCNVTARNATTITCALGLAYGLDNNWDTGDRYWIDNRPIVTHAALFDSGWSEVATNVWSHATTRHPGRHVWINGWSPNSSHHTGTCSAAGMATATDTQWCAICDSGTALDCGPAKVYIKSTSNPATRWTAPGVEVVHAWPHQTMLLRLGTRTYWTITGVNVEKVYGTPITLAGSNVTLEQIRLGWSQRSNCSSSGCWGGNTYTWLAGQDTRGGALLGMGASTPLTGLLLQDFLGHDCDDNCLSLTNVSGITATIRRGEVWNNFHSTLNSGLSGASSATRTLILDRLALHGACTVWHSGATGASHTATFSNSVVYDVTTSSDTRMFAATGCGRADPFGVFLEDPGTYTHSHNLLVDGGHGMRLKQGTHLLDHTVLTGNAQTGINAASGATVRLNTTILADNGSGAVSSNNFQAGCGSTPCATASFQQAASNTNKFHQPVGAAFGYMSGSDTSMTMAEWQAMSGGDAASVVTASCFVNAAGMDYTLADGCDDIAAGRGPFREITPVSATMVGTALTVTWTTTGVLPLSACDVTKAAVTYDAVAQTESSCVVNGGGNTTTLTLAAAPTPAQTVLLSGSSGLVQDSALLGTFMNAKSRAFSDLAVTVEGGAPPNYVIGLDRAIAAGSDRLAVLGICWEKVQGVAPDVTACTYGGQAMTQVAEQVTTSGTNPDVLASLWSLAEAGIAAATSTLFECTLNQAQDSMRPAIMASGVYTDITGALTDSDTATEATATSIATPALTTANPGIAVQLACSGNYGTFTSGAGWVTQTHSWEDTAPGTTLMMADRDTTGDTPTGAATFATIDTFDTRLALIAASYPGGSGQPPPATDPVRTQSASRCALHNEGSPSAPHWRNTLQDAPCTVVPQKYLTIISEYQVSAANEPTPTSVGLQCCVGACTAAEDFWMVDSAGTNSVRYAQPPDSTWTQGTALPDRLLTGAACTHVAGAVQATDAAALAQLESGECRTVAHVIQVTEAAPATLTCRLAQPDGTPLAAGAATTITVVGGRGYGF